MTVKIEHEIGDCALGMALAKDAGAAGVALLSMALSVAEMKPDEIAEFIGEVRYQILKRSNTANEKDLFNAVRVIEKIADGLSK